jgi:hypothetical protein
MKTFGRCVAELVVAAALLAAAQAGAMTIAGPDAAVNTANPPETVVEGAVTSVDAKQGVLVVDGRSYRFDPATVSFLDERRPPPGGGLAALKAGSKVTLRIVELDGTKSLLQIIVRD